MSRSLVTLRDARPEDADTLARLWSDGMRRAEHAELVADVDRILARVVEADDRVVVAEAGGDLVGAIYLRHTTVSSLNLEPVVHLLSPSVLPDYRRHGVGRMLIDAGVAWAEERGVAHVATAVAASSRDANRFMARLALGPYAMLRVASTSAVRMRLANQVPVGGTHHRGGARQITQVLAARRSMRRAQAASTN